MSGDNNSRRPAPAVKPLAELLDDLLVNRNEQDKFSPTQLDTLAKAIKRQAIEQTKGKAQVNQVAGLSDPENVRALVDGIYTAYNSADRQTVTGAGDVIQAIAAFCRAIGSDPTGLPQSKLLADSFVGKAVERGSFDKHDIHVLNNLLPYARSETWPTDLMERMFVETWSNDSRFVAGRVIVSMFEDRDYCQRVLKRENGTTSSKREDLVSDILLDKVANTDHHISLKPMSQFILPVLFERQPELVHILLDRTSAEIDKPSALSPEAAIHLWIRIVATASTLSLVAIKDLDAEKLEMCMHHAIDGVRLACWTSLTASKAASDRVEIDCLDMIEEWFQSNMRVHNADFRGTFSAAFRKFVERLRLSASAAQKQIDKPLPKNRQGKPEEESAWEEEQEASQAYIDDVLYFLQNVLRNVITPALEFPSMTGHARVITALDMVQTLALELEPQSGKDEKRKVEFPTIFTEERVEHLLACLGGNFSDIRTKSLEVLMLAPLPLPGYSSVEQQDMLLESAFSRLDGNRKSDAEAGSLVLQVMCRKDESGNNARAIGYVDALLDRLEGSIEDAEKELTLVMQKQPMHGTLSAIARIILASSWDHTKELPALESLSKRSIALVHRIWDLSKRILSSEGSNTADHEIARIYDMMEDDIDEGAQDTGYVNLLSNCWRAIKESSNLVANIFVVTMSAGLDSKHGYWTSEDVRDIGNMYLGWLYHIRHRGTFTAIAPDFERFVNVTASVKVSPGSDRTLRQEWLESQLEVVAAGEASTTRRSAAIPACILALVQASLPLFAHAHKRLVEIIEAGNTPDKARVHALHTLRTTVLDARQTRFIGDFFERTAIVALAGCKSADWSVRNSALLLFAHLATRMFGKGLNHPGTVYDKRIGIVEWNSRYPLLLPAFVKLLSEATSKDEVDSSVILVLAMLRHLESRPDPKDQLSTQTLLRDLSKKLLASPELKVRQASADAIASLTPKQVRHKDCLDIVGLSHVSRNERHGNLLLAESLLKLGMEINAEQKLHLVNLLKAHVHEETAPPLIMATITDILVQCSVASVPHVTADESVPIGSSNLSTLPGTSLWQSAETRLQSGLASANSSAALNQALLPGASPDERIEALQDLSVINGTQEDLSSVYRKLRSLYDITTHVPLKEAILPALAPILAKSPANDSVADLNYLIGTTLEEERSAESRFAGCQALRHVVPSLSGGNIDPERRIQSWLLLKRTLSDDDAEIRDIAASVVSLITTSSYSLCRDQAIREWWTYMQEEFRDEPEWHRELIRLLMMHNVLDRTLETLFYPTDELFARELPNLFFEPVTELTDVAKAYKALRTRIKLTPHERAHFSATSKQLKQARSGANGSSPLDAGRDERKLLDRYLQALADIPSL